MTHWYSIAEYPHIKGKMGLAPNALYLNIYQILIR